MRRWFLFFMICILSACIDEIELNLPENNTQRKVVEGYVERDQNNYYFWGQVGLTQNVTGVFRPEQVDAIISLRYNGVEEFSIPQKTVYRVPIEEFHQIHGGDVGTARFQLVAQVGTEKYVSSEQQIILVPTPDSLSVETEDRAILNPAGNIVTRTVVNLLVHTPLLNARNEMVSLNWVVGSTFQFVEGMRSDPDYQIKTCYSTSNIYSNDINIVAVQDYPGKNRLENIEIASTISDFRFSIAAYFTVVQKSLSQEAIEYWKEVKASNERSGNLYDVFPGRIRSNITNENDRDEIVTGFFQVSEVDTIRIKVKADQAGFPAPKCALWVEPIIISSDDPDPCPNCLKLANSTLIAPPYWR